VTVDLSARKLLASLLSLTRTGTASAWFAELGKNEGRSLPSPFEKAWEGTSSSLQKLTKPI
jgi:hypothetical protein